MTESPAAALRRLLAGQTAVLAPSAFDATSARLIEDAGFGCVHASGGAMSRSMGYPDLGLVGLSETVSRLAELARTCRLPIVADADTGYGNALNVRRTVQEFERVGMAGLHLEDQQFPKRCGLYDGIAVIPKAEMVGKLHAALDARRDADFVIVARTDAVAAEGFEAGLERAAAYAEAGVDMLFVEGAESEDRLRQLAAAVRLPLLYNRAGLGDHQGLPIARLAELNVRLVIYPADLQRAATFAMIQALAAIRKDGDSVALRDRLVTGRERDGLVDLPAYLDLSKKYGS